MQNLAYILIGLGILALIGWGVQGFFLASDIPLVIRIAVGVVTVGVLVPVGVTVAVGVGVAVSVAVGVGLAKKESDGPFEPVNQRISTTIPIAISTMAAPPTRKGVVFWRLLRYESITF